MTVDFYERTTCRLCGCGELFPALKLPSTPPANDFLLTPAQQNFYPLEVRLCSSCAHAQLGHVVNPKLLFDNYLYVSGTSRVFIDHFKSYSDKVKKSYLNNSNDFVLEIGSNDGTLLSFFDQYRTLGIEPAVKIAETANAVGIPTMNSYFDASSAKHIVEHHGKANVILANNVFAHVDDLNKSVGLVKECLAIGGVFIMEVQYLGAMLSQGLFDMIYFEHLDYHSATPLINFFESNDLKLFDIELVPTHGGSIRCYVCHIDDDEKNQTTNIHEFIKYESESEINSLAAWRVLHELIDKTKFELNQHLASLKHQGKKIIAYGAPAKLTTLMYTFELSAETISYIVDDSPLKIGRYSPGLHIPVRNPDFLYSEEGKADVILITAWNFSESIIKKHSKLTGVTWITPLPNITFKKND